MKDKNIKLDINVKPPEKMSVDFLGGVEVVTLKGKDGKTPTKEELESIIKPLIPEPIKGDKGDKGDSYVLSSKDKKEIAKAIDVPIVEKVIEKIEVIKEVPAKLTSKELTSKINELENVIDKKVIKGLDDFSLKSDLDRAVSILDQRTQFLINRQNGSATSGLSYQGLWNANTNTPTLASGVGTSGHYYIVSVAGSTNLDGITDWAVGDWAIFSSTGVWQKIDNSDVGVTTVGAIDSQTPSSNGLVISGSSIYAQSATDTAPGLVNTGGQTFAGDKLFTGKVSIYEDDTMTVNGTLINTKLAVHDDDGLANASLEIHKHSSTAGAGASQYFARSQGTGASPTIVQNGDVLALITAVGYDGTDYATAGQIEFSVSGTPGSNDMPTKFTLKLSEDGTQNLATKMEIAPNGVATFYMAAGHDDLNRAYGQGSTQAGWLAENTNSAGQSMFKLQNDLGTAAVGYFTLGGSTNSIGNIFGVDRKNRVMLLSDGASSSGMLVGTLTNDDLIIGTNNTNRIQILGSNGYVGVGTTAPTETLEVGGSGFVVNSGALSGIQIAVGTSNSDGMWIAGATKAGGYISTYAVEASKWLINGVGHAFQTSPVTTSGNTRTWTTRLAIPAGNSSGTPGDVGIGGAITNGALLTGAVLKIRNATNIEHTATAIANTNMYNLSITQASATANENGIGVLYTSSGRTGGTTKLFKGTYTSNAGDGAGHTVTIFSAENIGGSSLKTAYQIGTGYSYSILDYSGNFTTADIDLTIQTANLSGTDADGYNIRITAADGYNSGIAPQDGGSVYIRGGEGINGGDFGHLYLNSDGSNEYGYVGVGSTGIPLSRLDVAGSFGIKTRTVTTTPVTAGDEVLIEVNDDTIGGAGTVNLPASAGVDGRVYVIKKTGTTGNVTIDPDGTEKIDGASTKVLTTQYEVLRIVAKSGNWSVI